LISWGKDPHFHPNFLNVKQEEKKGRRTSFQTSSRGKCIVLIKTSGLQSFSKEKNLAKSHNIIIVDNLGKGSSPQNNIRVCRDKSKDEENKKNETKTKLTEERSRDAPSLGTQQLHRMPGQCGGEIAGMRCGVVFS